MEPMQNEPSISARQTCPRCGFTNASPDSGGLCPRCLWTSSLFRDDPDPLLPSSTVPDGSGGTVATRPAPPRILAGYELLEEIARGGMGVVYKARQTTLNRIVAVKVLAGGPFASPEFIRRFRAEAETVARLRHANIVAIHEVGETDGLAFFTMDFVDGPNLAERARGEPFLPREAAACLETIARAVAYAHAQGVLHRDLKPSNVLLDLFGQPQITDFGLAKRLTHLELETSNSEMTQSGQSLGSPGYAAPEQIRAAEADARSDIYGLGATLYHLLIGRPPFAAATPLETLRAAQDEDPVPPRALNPQVPRDLETICLKCLEKEPAKRYASAEELADELDRFLKDEPIQARPIGSTARLWRWCRRKPALAASLVTVILLALVLSIGSPVAALHIRRERDHARVETLRARQSEYAASMLLAQQALAEGNLGRASELIERHRPSASGLDLRGWEWRYLAAQTRSDELATLGTHSNIVFSVAFSPDGRWIVSTSLDGEARVWEAATRKLHATLHHPPDNLLCAAAFSPDGTVLATGADLENKVRLWRVPAFELAGTLINTNDHRINAIAFSPDGRRLVAGGGRGVDLWDLASTQRLASLPLRQASFDFGLTFSPDGRQILYSSGDGGIVFWDIESRRIARTLVGHSGTIASLGFTPDAQRLVSGGADGTRVWSTVNWTLLARFTNQISGAAKVSPDGQLLATWGGDRRIRILGLETGTVHSTLQGHLHLPSALAWSPDGSILVSGGMDHSVRLWSPLSRPEIPSQQQIPQRLEEHSNLEQRFSLSPDSSWLTTVYTNRTFSLWNTSTLTESERQPWPFDYLECISMSSGARWVALGGSNGVVKVIDRVTSRELVSTNFGHGRIRGLRLSGDGRCLALYTWDDLAIRVVTCPELEPLMTLPDEAFPHCMQFSPDSRYLAVGNFVNEGIVLDLDRALILPRLRGHQLQVRGIAITRDGRRVATASADGTVRLWDTNTGRQLRSFSGQFDECLSVAFSPDETRLAAGTDAGMVHIWDLDSRQEVLSVKAHADSVHQLGFPPDGSSLISASPQRLRVWRAGGPQSSPAPGASLDK